jgi:hypothetical protein
LGAVMNNGPKQPTIMVIKMIAAQIYRVSRVKRSTVESHD